MRRFLLVLVFAVGCGPSLVGNWVFSNASTDGNTGLGLDMNLDGGYVLATIDATGTNTANAQVEVGTYTSTASTLSFTPTRISCDGATDAPYTVGYAWDGNDLDVSFSFGVVVFAPDTTSGTSVAITYGCFSDAGFTPEPLEPPAQN